MNIDKVHPQLRKTFGRVPAIPFHNRIFLAIVKLLSRIRRGIRPMPGVTIVDQKLDSAGVRIYRPEGEASGAGMLWIHGGGYVIGNVATNDRECARYARDLKITVVSVEYRLAPEHPFPCAMDDCFEAWHWFLSNAGDLGVSPDRIAISGQSAGGGLAAGLVQRVFDCGARQPAGQALFYPMLDDRTAVRWELDACRHRLWNNRNNRGGWTYYLGQAPGEPEVPPYAVPARRADLSGLPPGWVGVGDIDLFCEEDALYSSRLREAGVNCELETVPGAPHGFDLLVADAQITHDFIQSNYAFLRRVLKL